MIILLLDLHSPPARPIPPFPFLSSLLLFFFSLPSPQLCLYITIPLTTNSLTSHRSSIIFHTVRLVSIKISLLHPSHYFFPLYAAFYHNSFSRTIFITLLPFFLYRLPFPARNFSLLPSLFALPISFPSSSFIYPSFHLFSIL